MVVRESLGGAGRRGGRKNKGFGAEFIAHRLMAGALALASTGYMSCEENEKKTGRGKKGERRREKKREPAVTKDTADIILRDSISSSSFWRSGAGREEQFEEKGEGKGERYP